ncbi:MAG: PKD domain-containing protein, partial [Bryobacteraceae bacterium]
RLALLVAAPTLFLCLVEVALRVGGYGYPTTFFVASPDGRAYVANEQFRRRFAPPSMSPIMVPVQVPATKELRRPLIQGNLAVSLGNNGGFNGSETLGNIVVTTFDMTDVRNPAILASVTTSFKPGTGGGAAARIGDDLFLFAGVRDSTDRDVLLLVDTVDPKNPVLRSWPVVMPVTRMVAVGNVLHATHGAGGYAAYRIPGIDTVQFNAEVQVPKNTGVTYDPASFTLAPSSILTGSTYDTLVWNNPAHTVISWDSTLTGMQAGEVRPVALGGTVSYSGSLGSGILPLPLVSVASEQILGLNPSSQTVQAGTPAAYMLTVKNPASSEITYSLALAGIPAPWLPLPATLTVPAAGRVTIPLTLLAGATAAAGTYTFLITATGGGAQGSVQGQVTLTGPGAQAIYGVSLSISPTQATVRPGTSADFALQIGNLGSAPDTYALSAVVPAGITATFDTAGVPVQPGGTGQANLRLTVAPGAPAGQAVVLVRASSTASSLVLDEKNATLDIVGGLPTANAGSERAVPLFRPAVLDGSASSDPNTPPLPLTYAWTILSKPPTSALSAIINASSARASFIPDVLGDYAFRLTVSNGVGSSTADVTMHAQPFPPVAEAGPNRNVKTGAFVTLNGRDSFGYNGTPLTYSWQVLSAPAGSAAILRNAQTPKPYFKPDVDGVYTLQLVVTDGPLSSTPDTVQIAAFSSNVPPNADAGQEQNAAAGHVVTLDGSASFDPENAALTYNWTFSQTPADSLLTSATIANAATAHAQFVPDVAGDYVLALQVSDGQLASQATVTVHAFSGNVPPNADAGADRYLALATPATPSGAASSDPDNGPQPLTYKWIFSSVQPGSQLQQLTGSDLVQASFTPDAAGYYVARVRALDGADVGFANTLVTVAGACDADASGTIDANDIGLILAALGRAAQPGDPRDKDGDGTITAADVVACNSLVVPADSALSVRPAAETLAAGQTKQFTALLGGQATNAVTWSIAPETGTISSSGLYTAPAEVPSQTVVTVTATSTLNPAAKANAAVTLTVASVVVQYDQCIWALNPSASDALKISGSVNLNAPACGVVVNSASSTAMKVNGSGSLTAKYIDVVGGFSRSGSFTISPAPHTGADRRPDPLGFLVPPASGACDQTNFRLTAGSATLNPGTYCGGIKISGSVNATFNPGVYILLGGGFDVSGSGTL